MSDGTQFDGKSVLVTGGSRGIGAAIVRRFASLGAKVAIGYRAEAEAAETVAHDIEGAGGKAVTIAGDVAVPGDAEALVSKAHDALGSLDILVNSAGIMENRLLGDVDEALYRTIFDVNVLGTMMLTKCAAPLLPSPGGRIVLFSSRLAYSPMPTSSVYSASKAAVITLTHTYAKELGPRGITVNAIAPGVIETDMTTQAIAERGDVIIGMTPLGRLGQTGDIAGIVTFLASPEAGWITGRTIIADGGLN